MRHDDITDRQREVLSEVAQGCREFHGPLLALANKLWRAGFLHRDTMGLFSLTDQGRIAAGVRGSKCDCKWKKREAKS